MTKTKNAASAATAKPCPHPDDQYTIPLVETHRGSVLVRSDFADVTRDAVAAVAAFFENEANGFREPVAIHPSWSTATLLDDFGDKTELVVSGPDAVLVERAGRILAASFDIELAGESDEPKDRRDDADDESTPANDPADLDQRLIDAYAELGAVYTSYARALASNDGEVADRCALSMTTLETRIEKLEAASLGDWSRLSDRELKAINPEARAERIFAVKDAKRGLTTVLKIEIGEEP